jgi:hypothetical protein
MLKENNNNIHTQLNNCIIKLPKIGNRSQNTKIHRTKNL